MDKVQQTDRYDALQTDVFKVCDSLLVLIDQMGYLKRQSRRNNLVLEGILESPGETWSETEEKVKKVLKEKFQIKKDIEMERAHRTGKAGGD